MTNHSDTAALTLSDATDAIQRVRNSMVASPNNIALVWLDMVDGTSVAVDVHMASVNDLKLVGKPTDSDIETTYQLRDVVALYTA